MAGNNSSQYRYKHYKFCKKCNEWLPWEYVTCPSCGSHLRGTPRRAYCRRHYRNSRKYSPADAQRIFERFLGRGYSVEEAAEATLAITGLRPAIRVLMGGLEKTLAED